MANSENHNEVEVIRSWAKVWSVIVIFANILKKWNLVQDSIGRCPGIATITDHSLPMTTKGKQTNYSRTSMARTSFGP